MVLLINKSYLKEVFVLGILMCLCCGFLNAQFNIGTNATNTDAVTHFSSADSSQGIILPIVITTNRPTCNNVNKAMLIYNLTDSVLQYCNGTVWVNVKPSTLEDLDKDTKIQVEESADEDYIRFDTKGTQRMIIDDEGNIGINSADALPEASSILDVSSTDKGLLIPRVALNNKSDATTVPSPATSLLVYNTATSGAGSNRVTPGFYYYDGAEWAELWRDAPYVATYAPYAKAYSGSSMPGNDLDSLFYTAVVGTPGGILNQPPVTGNALIFSVGNGTHGFQLGHNFEGGGSQLYMRSNHNQNWGNWIKYWNESHFADADISNWDEAYSWGDHGSVGYVQASVTGSAGALAEWLNDSTITFDSTGASLLPVGTTAQRPSGSTGLLRLNSDINAFEGYYNAQWNALADQDWVTTNFSDTTNIMQDTDRDTKIQVEESADEDIIRFDTRGVERMQIDSSGDVGIGTSSPESRFHVKDGGQSFVADFQGSSSSIIRIGKNTLGGQSTVRLINSTTDAWIGVSNNMLGFSNVGQDTMKFVISNSEKLRITPDSKIGITTSNPSAKFHIHNDDAGADSAFVVTDEGNVGVGTIDPNRKFELVSATNGNAMRIEVPASNGTVFDFYMGNAAGNKYLRANPAILEFQRQGGPSVIRTVGSMNDLGFTTDNGDIYFDPGVATAHVGINTTSPDTTLHIEGTLKMVDGNESNGYVMVSDASGVATWMDPSTITTADDGDWTLDGDTLYSAPDSTMVIKGGNVGIGTLNPSFKLEVIGGSRVFGTGTSPTQRVLTVGDTLSETPFILQAANSTDWDERHAFTISDKTGASRFWITNSSAASYLSSEGGALFFNRFANDVYIGDYGNNRSLTLRYNTGNIGVGFGTSAGNPGSKLSVNGGMTVGSDYRNLGSPTNGLLVQGNVGIGTNASNSSKLTIMGSSNDVTTLSFFAVNSDGDRLLQIRNNGKVIFGDDNGNQPSISPHHANGGDGVNADLTSARGLLFYSNYSSAAAAGMYVFNHAIGQTSVDNDVTRNISILGGTSNNSINNMRYESISIRPTINTSGGSTTVRGIFYSPTMTGTTGLTHVAFQNTFGDVLVGTNSGNLGIGTTTPDEKLHIEGSLKMVDGNESNGYVMVSDASGVAAWTDPSTISTANDGDWTLEGDTLYSAPDSTMVIKGGNVGIGTISASSKLQVRGEDNVAGTSSFTVQNNSGNTVFNVRNNGAVGLGIQNQFVGFIPSNTGTIDLAGRSIRFQSNTSSTSQYGFYFGSVNGTLVGTSGTQGLISTIEGFGPSSGNAEYNVFNIATTINQTGGANGITRGIYIHPSLTSVSDFRAVEIENNSANTYGIYQSGSSTSNYFAGNVGIGTTSPSGLLEVNGGQFGSPIVDNGNVSGATTINWGNGNIQHVTLTGDVTLTFSNGLSGRKYVLIVKQDATGSHSITWDAAIRFSGATGTLDATPTASKTDYFGFFYNSIDAKYDNLSYRADY